MAVSYEMLLHPEFLSNEQLMLIIQERYLRIPNIEEMTRDQLLDIFHHYCVPYGQRKCRESGRARQINRTHTVSPEPANVYDLRINGNLSQPESNTSFSNCKRLKPPPDMLPGHIKRVKIEGRTTVINNVYNINKRKVPTDMMTPVVETTTAKKPRKQITWP